MPKEGNGQDAHPAGHPLNIRTKIVMLKTVVTDATSHRCTASFIFLHGSGDSGPSLRQSMQHFNFPHVKIIYPSAPLQSYSLIGDLSNVWFDRQSLELDGYECKSSIDSMAEQLTKLVQAEVKSGIPENRIIVGGFSMGACMALHLGLRYLPNLATVVSLSTFLYNSSQVYSVLEEEAASRRPPVLMCHGEQDDLVPYSWGRATSSRLSKSGAHVTFKPFPFLGHSLSMEELDFVKSWVMEKVPDE